MKKFLVIASLVLFTSMQVNAKDVWVNNLRSEFLNNSSVIYAINIRTFNAKDKDGNGIIDFEAGEESGNFINAIDRLDELKAEGITALHLLPVTPVGKTKALGTAGSLYAAAGFDSLNPQLKSSSVDIPLEEQARKFIQAAHDRGISVIMDVPACGSYDLFLQSPELFVKDASGQPVVPADWTDVRLLDAGNENNINPDVLRVYKRYVDFVMGLGVDGIRVDVAHSKPAKFWKELIDYSRKHDKEFLWLAESSDSWKDPVSPKAVYTPYDNLLEAGFDGYYGSYFNLKNWKTAKELQAQVNLNISLEKKLKEPKSVIGSFTTHDELSPILEKGRDYSRMIMWLNATLPLNSYFVDGFDTGDKYIYFWANQKAKKTYTDDEYYFAHRGKIDIFNFSRKPGGKDFELQKEFIKANECKTIVKNILKDGTFKFLKTSEPSVFAYTATNSSQTVIVIGNLNFRESYNNVKISVPKITKETEVMPIVLKNIPFINKGKIVTNLAGGETQVFIIDKFSIK